MNPHEPIPSKGRRWIFALLVLLLLAVTCGAGYWAYGKFKTRQSKHLATLANEYLRKGNMTEAAMSLETALRLQPKNVEVLRLLAQVQGSRGDGAKSLESWRKLAESGVLSIQDLSQYSVTAAREGDWALAERLASVAAGGGNTALGHLLRSDLLFSKNDLPGAEAELRMAIETDVAGTSQAALARFLLAHRLNAETAPEILEILQGLSKRPDAIGVEAVTTAMTRGLVPPADLPDWIATLRNNPKSTGQALLLADNIEIQTKPSSKSAVLEKMLQRMQGASLQDRTAGAKFLLLMKEPKQAVDLLTRDEALKQREILSLWLQAQSLSQNWPAILDALAQPNLPLPEFLKKLFLGSALVMSGQVAEGRALYSEGLQIASSDHAEFLEALAYISLIGEDQVFDQGLQQLLSNSDNAKDSFLRLLPSVLMRRDAIRTRRAYEIAAATSPELANDLTLQNDMNFLGLLLNLPVDQKNVAFLCEANPRDFAFRATRALSLLKAGKNKEALTLLENCEPDIHVTALTPSHKALLAAAFVANNRRNDARSVMALLAPQQLSIQEIKFLQTYLNDTKTEPTPAESSPETKKKPNPKKK
jgi:thioredoxin-like negative regulator of GroEL